MKRDNLLLDLVTLRTTQLYGAQFQVFEGIDVLIIKERNQQKQIIINLNPIHSKIIGLMGEYIKKFYRITNANTPDG